MNRLVSILGAGATLFQPVVAQTEYSADGNPTERVEEFRWHLNRGRFNPAAENTLRGTNYTDILTPRGPLAPNANLIIAARNHAEDMATKNLFQHETVPNSAFYNQAAHAASSLRDFFDRAIDSGYRPNAGQENITAGRSQATAISVYLAWWGSQGHRIGMYDDYREMGEGTFFRAAATYGHYDALTVARRNAFAGFFTDTLFHDTNADGSYTASEGRSGIRVELMTGGTLHPTYDLSSSAGSFAIPMDGITAGTPVQVHLTHTGGTSTTLSVPQDFHTLRTITLQPGQRWLLGSFTRAANANAGFRGMTFNNALPVPAPQVTIRISSGQAVVSWESQAGLTYQVQWSSDISSPWTNLHPSALPGTGSIMSQTDPATTATVPRRFYRVVVTRP